MKTNYTGEQGRRSTESDAVRSVTYHSVVQFVQAQLASYIEALALLFVANRLRFGCYSQVRILQLYRGHWSSAGQGTVEQDGIGRTSCRSRFPYVYKYEAGPHRRKQLS